jgi:DNA-binding transcriptional regulator YiaG
MTRRGNVPRVTPKIDEAVLAELPHERLRRMLDRAGLKNPDVASELGVVTETVSRWRSGVQAIDDPALLAIVRLLADRGIVVTAGWMRYGEVTEVRRVAETSPASHGAPPSSAPRLPGGAKFEADHVAGAERPSAKRRRKSG